MRHPIQTIALLGALLLPALATGAQAPNYQPLAPSLVWQYTQAFAGSWTTDVDNQQTVRGQLTVAMLEEIVTETDQQAVRNFWTVDTEGNVYLHGTENLTDAIAFAYDPPILWLDAPLEVDKSWTSSGRVYLGLNGFIPIDSYDISMRVFEEVDLVVPYGPYHTFGIEQALPVLAAEPGGARYHLLGLRVADQADGPAKQDLTAWYSDGIGRVQMNFEDAVWQLQDWNGPAASRPSSWGQVKSLYR